MEPDACPDLRKIAIHTRDVTRKLTGDLLQGRNRVASSDSRLQGSQSTRVQSVQSPAVNIGSGIVGRDLIGEVVSYDSTVTATMRWTRMKADRH